MGEVFADSRTDRPVNDSLESGPVSLYTPGLVQSPALLILFPARQERVQPDSLYYEPENS
jgi:hypothetical protein